MTRTRFASLAGRRRAVVVVCCVALVGLVGVASASWLTSKGANGSAGATSVQAVANASVSLTVVSSTQIDVKVTNVPAGGPTPSSYLIKNGTTTVCATAALNATCHNTGLTANTSYTYNVFSNLNNWVSSANATATTTTSASTPVVSGIVWSGLTPDAGKTMSCDTTDIANIKCQVSGVGNKNGFTAAKVQLIDQNQNAINNTTGSAVSVSLSKDSGTFTPTTPALSIANNASTSGSSFAYVTANGNVTGTVTASVTIASHTYTVNIKVIP